MGRRREPVAICTLAGIVGFGHLVLPRAFATIARQTQCRGIRHPGDARRADRGLARAEGRPVAGARRLHVGVLLSRSPFHHQIAAEVTPFKGLLLGLFFISVGMSMDLTLLVDGGVRSSASCWP